ncbi:hypothetical protein GNI_093210 [Gregarina niphandrodes]|uniref:Uncharacterized protein n=1 Tax=Gregarina niphandrodes TaxID=110365 RepID=A0A023B5D5_GRENI|nr:hypothetical protein GNI_093210 [Gregarina niphandrodes]EZG59052.1 hypothetical protein GNI_093210 [Gregarina niphandrodes]|eukprot:XP_011130918.1 hypothetical protein GNI_093210 [Gregarina niphandrodes]
MSVTIESQLREYSALCDNWERSSLHHLINASTQQLLRNIESPKEYTLVNLYALWYHLERGTLRADAQFHEKLKIVLMNIINNTSNVEVEHACRQFFACVCGARRDDLSLLITNTLLKKITAIQNGPGKESLVGVLSCLANLPIETIHESCKEAVLCVGRSCSATKVLRRVLISLLQAVKLGVLAIEPVIPMLTKGLESDDEDTIRVTLEVMIKLANHRPMASVTVQPATVQPATVQAADTAQSTARSCLLVFAPRIYNLLADGKAGVGVQYHAIKLLELLAGSDMRVGLKCEKLFFRMLDSPSSIRLLAVANALADMQPFTVQCFQEVLKLSGKLLMTHDANIHTSALMILAKIIYNANNLNAAPLDQALVVNNSCDLLRQYVPISKRNIPLVHTFLLVLEQCCTTSHSAIAARHQGNDVEGGNDIRDNGIAVDPQYFNALLTESGAIRKISRTCFLKTKNIALKRMLLDSLRKQIQQDTVIGSELVEDLIQAGDEELMRQFLAESTLPNIHSLNRVISSGILGTHHSLQSPGNMENMQRPKCHQNRILDFPDISFFSL